MRYTDVWGRDFQAAVARAGGSWGEGDKGEAGGQNGPRGLEWGPQATV